MSTNITFAKTFDESELTTSLENQRIYSQGYLNFINSNNLGSQKSHNNFTFTQGDPVKVRDYIMSKLKLKNLILNGQLFGELFLAKFFDFFSTSCYNIYRKLRKTHT